MKRIHWVLLVVTVTMALVSAYSLAAINKVYKINYQWYSPYQKTFSVEARNTEGDKWSLPHLPKEMKMEIITSDEGLSEMKKEGALKAWGVSAVDLDDSVLIYCALGPVHAPEYGMKVLSLVQRGNVVEIKVSLNSPAKLQEEDNKLASYTYWPGDLVKISRSAFTSRGGLYFIFKNQDGGQIGARYCLIN